ncbi:YheC/YheD family protein [Staphylococcus haemolyticus]|uniref:YheC/YheD family protein n=2 Tax=Staphylococcus TaxID=1279 RepID=UPI001A93FEAF|nr:YheC/YheD family protein [Staphylococcus haemolyticus]QTK08150.1 YheC/YheD family protein [Staphylococcus haemolyticus]QTK10316.1 YheC/YheD family protein [Staphylococcus haemolyticus]QTK12500.1 YheC/YheD family protein [Staphylococcus haemolyticus]
MKNTRKKPLIGMLRHFENPNTMAKAAALSAEMLDCDFFFFNPKDVDINHKNINGLFLKNGEWIRMVTEFPDVIDNSPSKKISKNIYQELEKTIPFTMHRIGNKDFVNKRLINERYAELVIPYRDLKNINDVKEMLSVHSRIIIKPSGGNRGKGIIYIEKKDDKYTIRAAENINTYNETEVEKYIYKLTNKNYIVQKYISSVTKSSLPFDIRIHVRRGEGGNWQSVKIYPRIGSGRSVESNLSQGGSIAKIVPFLKYNFAEKWKVILDELRKLAKEFPVYFQKVYDYELDALGLDIGIDENGKLWLFEVNSFPGCTMFELEAQEVAMKYAKYLALQEENKLTVNQIVKNENKKPVIAMLSPSKGISKLKMACVAAASMYNCEFFYFTPDDIDYGNKIIHGKTYINHKWETKEYSYIQDIDVVYDRIRLVGRKKYKKIYDTLSHIPLTHNAFGGSLNKIEVYDKFKEEGSLAEYIIPYIYYQNTNETIKFIKKYKKIIIKPQIGLMGNDLYYIELSDKNYRIVYKNKELSMNQEEFEQWLNKTVDKNAYVVQKYIMSRTKDYQAFDIRSHLMRNYNNKWEIVVILPRIGIEFEKMTPMKLGGYTGLWEGFIKRNYGDENYETINKKMRWLSRRFTDLFEELFKTKISEIGIDFAIDENGHIYLLELNLRRPGFLYYEFDVAKRAIGYAKYLSEINKK